MVAMNTDSQLETNVFILVNLSRNFKHFFLGNKALFKLLCLFHENFRKLCSQFKIPRRQYDHAR